MKVLVACEFSGVVRRAFRDRGHDAFSCDLLPAEDGSKYHFQRCIKDILHQGFEWDLMIAHPPCTHLASSGARYFSQKRADGRQKEAADFFILLATSNVRKICVENPVGVMSTLYQKPDQIIQPWQFGHAETKATCLWLKNLPELKPSKIVEPDYMRKADGTYYTDKKGKRYSRIHFMSGRMKNDERWKARSRTYQGIADAMAEQWE